MIMGEGNPRVVGGWVLLPLVGERFMVWWGGCLWQPPLRFHTVARFEPVFSRFKGFRPSLNKNPRLPGTKKPVVSRFF